MNGTTITTNKSMPKWVSAFNLGGSYSTNDTNLKTVNIYSFSPQSWRQVSKRLDSWISIGKVNSYYEAVFSEMVADGSLNFQCVYFDSDFWYEIDTIEDLYECEKLMLHTKQPLSAVV